MIGMRRTSVEDMRVIGRSKPYTVRDAWEPRPCQRCGIDIAVRDDRASLGICYDCWSLRDDFYLASALGYERKSQGRREQCKRGHVLAGANRDESKRVHECVVCKHARWRVTKSWGALKNVPLDRYDEIMSAAIAHQLARQDENGKRVAAAALGLDLGEEAA